MPLVNYGNNFLALTAINVGEEIFISLVNEDMLHSWEEYICCLNVPVDQVLIKAFLSESFGTSLLNLLNVCFSFICPE